MFQEKYDLNEIKDILKEEVDLIFLGERKDERSLFLKKSFSEYKGDFVYLWTDESCDKLSFIQTDAKDQVIREVKDKPLIKGILELLVSLNVQQKKVMVDITGIQQVILFLLINRLLTVVNPKLLFAAYTEPVRYIKNEDHTFNLSELNKGFQNLPGFYRRDRESNNLLVVIVGFENHRLLALLEEVQPPPKRIVPIVGFPAYQPGWKLTTIISNSRALSEADCLGNIYTCEAASPYKLYRLLEHLSDQIDGQEFRLAPLGTRPHALGAAIFASLRRNCIVLYDCPTEKETRSIGIAKTNIYNLSRFITPKYESK